MKKLAALEQVLCVTHLAQVASYADHHYFVDKRSGRGRAYSTIDELDRPGRTRQIDRMLSGERLTPEALKHAEQWTAPQDTVFTYGQAGVPRYQQ